MIFFFTGTGNSLYVARALAEALDDRIVSIPQALASHYSLHGYYYFCHRVSLDKQRMHRHLLTDAGGLQGDWADAYREVPLSLGPVLESTSYLYVTAFGALIFKEKVTPKKLAALALIGGGICVFALLG